MALNIKDPETDALARRLAELTGRRITEAVKEALRERVAVEERRRASDREARMARIRALLEEYRSLPVVDPREPDEILGYDEHGLPR